MATSEPKRNEERRTDAAHATPASTDQKDWAVDTDEALPPGSAAILIGVAKATLANWRSAGSGPPFIKLGTSRTSAIRYRRSAIEAYLARMTHDTNDDTEDTVE